MFSRIAIRSLSSLTKLTVAALLSAPAVALAGDVRIGDVRVAMLEPSPASADDVLTVSNDFYARAQARDGASLRKGIPDATEPRTRTPDARRVAPAYVNVQGKPVGGYISTPAAQ